MGTVDDDVGPELAAWDVALRIGRGASRFSTPLDAKTRRRLDTDFDEATARAEELVEVATGLRSTAGPARGLVVDRAGWIEANVGSSRRRAGRLASKAPVDAPSSPRRRAPPPVSSSASCSPGCRAGCSASTT